MHIVGEVLTMVIVHVWEKGGKKHTPKQNTNLSA